MDIRLRTPQCERMDTRTPFSDGLAEGGDSLVGVDVVGAEEDFAPAAGDGSVATGRAFEPHEGSAMAKAATRRTRHALDLMVMGRKISLIGCRHRSKSSAHRLRAPIAVDPDADVGIRTERRLDATNCGALA